MKVESSRNFGKKFAGPRVNRSPDLDLFQPRGQLLLPRRVRVVRFGLLVVGQRRASLLTDCSERDSNHGKFPIFTVLWLCLIYKITANSNLL